MAATSKTEVQARRGCQVLGHVAKQWKCRISGLQRILRLARNGQAIQASCAGLQSSQRLPGLSTLMYYTKSFKN